MRWRVIEHAFEHGVGIGEAINELAEKLVTEPRRWKPTIRGGDVWPGDLIGLGPGLALRVEQVIFDGPDGMLVGRADCDGPIDNGRHGVLRPGQPYAAVVSADGELSWLH